MNTVADRMGLCASRMVLSVVSGMAHAPLVDVAPKARAQPEKRRMGSRTLPQVGSLRSGARASGSSKMARSTAFRLPRAPLPSSSNTADTRRT
ncbi:hypothetical protein D3C78_1591270 [compost metagenome]